jgi:hypothetical protein
MSHRVACFTMFDITQTGVINRSRPNVEVTNLDDWIIKRNTQCNFDTILQVISLRSQPDVTKVPTQVKILFDDDCLFGHIYRDNKSHTCWTFDFEVQHSSVFEDGLQELGALYKDCQSVPMLLCNSEFTNLNAFLDTDKFTKNIYFVKY